MSTEVSRYRLDVDARAFRAHADDMERYVESSARGVERVEGRFRRVVAAVREGPQYLRATKEAADAFGRSMAGAGREADAALGTVEERSGRIRTALAAVGAAVSGATFAALAKGAFQLNSAAEQARISFTTLLGSAEAADAMLEEMAAFAARTPFEMAGLAENVKYMLAFRFEAGETLPMLEAIGDASASLGAGDEGIQRVVRALGQMKQSARVSAEEMGQLAEVGVGAWDYLADDLGLSIAEVRALAERGALDVRRSVRAILDGMREEFGGGMAALAESGEGALSTIRDSVKSAFKELTGGAYDEFKRDLLAVRDALADGAGSAEGERRIQAVRTALAQLYRTGRDTLRVLVDYGPALAKAYIGWKALAVVGRISALLAAGRTALLVYGQALALVRSRTVAATAALAAFRTLTGVGVVGALGLVGAALAAGGVALVAYSRHVRNASDVLGALRDRADEARRAVKALAAEELSAAREKAASEALISRSRQRAVLARILALQQGAAEPERQSVTEYVGGERFVRRESEAEARAREIEGLREEYNALAVDWTAAQETLAGIEDRRAGSLEDRVAMQRDEVDLAARLLEDARLQGRATGRLEANYRAAADELERLEGMRAGADDVGAWTPPVDEAALKRAQRLREQQAREEARLAEHRVQMEGVVVEAKRAMTDEGMAHDLAVRAERLARDRAEAEHAVALIEDEDERRRRSAEVRFQYDRDEQRLAREASEFREAAAKRAADADLAQAEREAALVEDAAERRRTVEAAEARHQLAVTEAGRRGAEERGAIETEAVRSRLDLFEAHLEDRRRAEEEAARVSAENLQDYFASDEWLAEQAALWEGFLRDGLVTSVQEVESGLAALREAYDAAGTDEERARIEALVLALEGLGVRMREASVTGTPALLRDLGEAVRLADELSGLFRTLGRDALADVARGMGDVLSSVERVVETADRLGGALGSGRAGLGGLFSGGVAGALASASSVAGLVGASVGALGALRDALFGNSAEQDRARQALAEARRATEANTRALLSGQVGEGLTRDQLDAYRAGAGAARGAVEGIFDGRFFDTGLSEANDALSAFLRSLEDAGLDVSEFQRRFEDARDLSAGARRDAFTAILEDMERRFGQIGAALGSYSDDLPGALAQLEDDLRQLGLGGADALAAFVEKLRAADLGPAVDALLDTMAALEPGTDEYEQALRDFYRRTRPGGDLTLPGSMSQDDLQDLLDAFRGIRAGEGEGSGPERGTQATSISTATVAQADLTNSYLQEILRALRAFFSAVTGGTIAPPPPRPTEPAPERAPDRTPNRAPDRTPDRTPPPADRTPRRGPIERGPVVNDPRTFDPLGGLEDARRLQDEALARSLAAVHAVLERAAAPAPAASRADLAALVGAAAGGARAGDTINVTVPATVHARLSPEDQADAIWRAVRPQLVRELSATPVRRGHTR